MQVTTEFEENWANGKVPGWENGSQENGHVPGQHTAIDLDYYSTVEELMEVGAERLKEVGLRIQCFISCLYVNSNLSLLIR